MNEKLCEKFKYFVNLLLTLALIMKLIKISLFKLIIFYVGKANFA